VAAVTRVEDDYGTTGAYRPRRGESKDLLAVAGGKSARTGEGPHLPSTCHMGRKPLLAAASATTADFCDVRVDALC
jgi:hypothetical protein